MTNDSLEDRVARLERLVERLVGLLEQLEQITKAQAAIQDTLGRSS